MGGAGTPSAHSRLPLRLLLATVIVLLVLVLYAYWRPPDLRSRFAIERTRPLQSRLDGATYRVHSAHEGAQDAADALARISEWTTALLRWLRARYIRSDRGAREPARRAAVEKLLARFSPDNLVENSPKDPEGQSAYAVEKGAVLAFCLRRKDGTERLHDMSTLLFVAQHELTHVAIDAIDHPVAFWEAFKWLLTESEEGGLYENVDYARHPVTYCGVEVTYNPYFDQALRML